MRDVTNEWTRISVLYWVSDGRSLEMLEERSPGVVLNMGSKWKGAVQNDAEALDLGGEGCRESVDDDGWSWGVLWLGDDGFGADEQGLGFTAI